MNHSPNNPTAADPSTRTIVEQTSEDDILNDTPSPEQSPNIPPWALNELSRIGFFDPDYPAPSNTTMDPIRTANRTYIYRDVLRFTERLRAVSATMEAAKFTTLLRFLPASFRNSASAWYGEELDELERDLLLSGDSTSTGIGIWLMALEARFGGDGHRLLRRSSSAVPKMGVGMAGGRKRKKKARAEKVEGWERRKGESLNEWQMRLGKRDA